MWHVAAILAASMIVAGCGNPSVCHSHPTTEVTVPVALPTDGGPADAGTQELVDGCHAMPDHCLPLCQRVIGPDYQTYTVLTCELTSADGGLALHVIYGGYCAV